MEAQSFFSRKIEEGLSRRDLFEGASAGILSSLAATILSGCGERKQATGSAVGSGAGALSPASMPKGFSREELISRWQRVRERMKQQRFDCLIVPARNVPLGWSRYEAAPDGKYLTETAANWVVFPSEGSITAFFENNRSAALVEEKKNWGMDLRAGKRDQWSLDIIDRLSELGMSQARIGVGGLSGVLQNAEGYVSFTTMDRIRKALPRATFESAADLLMRVKLVKSQEEIAALEKATEVSEAGLQTMMDIARPGIEHWKVWIQVFSAMTAASGEPPARVAFRAGEAANTSMGIPLPEVFRAGQIMTQELNGSVLGYASHINHAFCIGSPAPADWPRAAQSCIDLYNSLVDWIAPGKSGKEYAEFYRQKVQEREKGGTKAGGMPFFFVGALDGPRIGPTNSEWQRLGVDDWILEPGMVFNTKPNVEIRDTNSSAQFGDAILVTEKGARRLGKRKLEVHTVGA